MIPIAKALQRLKPPVAILCDYDDTTAVENVAELILNRFGSDGWRDLRDEFRKGRLTLREYQEAAFRTLSVGREEMMSLVGNHATLRPHFKTMYEYCREEGFPVAIVTNGLDFYVQALLEAQGLTDVPFYAVHARFLGREIRYEYPYAREGCSDFGNCKCVVLDKYRKQGYSIVYVGDGRSDFCAAANADLVFAHRDLVRFCETYGISWMPFSDFADVLNVVREISGGKR